MRGLKYLTIISLTFLFLTSTLAEQVVSQPHDIEVNAEEIQGEQGEYEGEEGEQYYEGEGGEVEHVEEDHTETYIAEADKNNDRQISKQELSNFFKKFIELEETHDIEDYAKSYFGILDANADGVVTAEEFKVLVQAPKEAEVVEEGEEGEEDQEQAEDL